MRAKLINEILDLAGDEFGREELIQLAKKNNNQLRYMWLYFKESERLKNYKIKGLKYYYHLFALDLQNEIMKIKNKIVKSCLYFKTRRKNEKTECRSLD